MYTVTFTEPDNLQQFEAAYSLTARVHYGHDRHTLMALWDNKDEAEAHASILREVGCTATVSRTAH